ncbi:putative transcriptional regulatory protein C1F7.11c [Hypsizygus marmoreus]|uniref:Transcriptional regulatory protein C1F7.11c n=1 Tax=Hypsizygus marmoreus TaxID=39966 RepID=A0A369JD52_HYPMA|nr:putative transcriptional regulatory protein C1F7.11c [Hypsizygus marmoreus]
MPVEPTKAKLKRRSSRKEIDEYKFDGSHARELEQKRNRGACSKLPQCLKCGADVFLLQESCAECRRLKIKCDKQIPCQSCQRRGCAALCPNGSLSTGQGTRFVLAATEHLHRRIAKLSGRIRQLEDALACLHAKHSTEPHPLLHEDLITNDEQDDEAFGKVEDSAAVVQGPAPDVIDAFGTLSISDHGISRFFGPTGGSESLLIANLNPPNPTPSSPSHSSSPSSSASTLTGTETLLLFSHAFPFTPMGPSEDVQTLIESHLPPWERAQVLCQTYFVQMSWIFRGVTRAQLIDDMLPVVYRRPRVQGEEYSSPHDLALIFMVFALGALVMDEEGRVDGEQDKAQEGGSPVQGKGQVELAEHYHQVARAAVALQPVLEKPSIVTIQTLHLMSIYNAMSGSDLRSETSMEMTWSLITLAAHLSQTIGLHRDSARWGLSPKMVQRRRILFWDLFVADVWQSLNTGRPPSFSLAYIDCSFPEPQDAVDGKEGAEGGFGTAYVTARTLTAEAPSYATIMELDRKVREFPLPEGMAGPQKDAGFAGRTTDNKVDMVLSFQRCVLDHIRETVLMYLHRSFFAQAIIEHPENPLKSAYAPSFLAAYRASSTILKSIREQFNMWPNSCARFWTMWTFAFSAAVVFGTVVTRGPRSPLAQSAMSELEQACILFSKASVYSIRASKALPILTKLSEKARIALAAAQTELSPLSGDNGGLLWNIKQEDTDDELTIFAGHTRFVSAKKTQPTTQQHHGPVVLSQELHLHSDQHIQHASGSMDFQSHSNHSLPPATAHHDSTVPPPQIVNRWASSEDRRDSYMPTMVLDEQPTPSMLYQPYVPSERTHQIEQQTYSGGWPAPETMPPPPSTQQVYHTQPVVPSQAQYGQPQFPSQEYRYQPQPQEYQQPPHQHNPHQHTHRLQPQHPQRRTHLAQPHYPPRASSSAFQAHLPNADLADLGLAARDSRLDERWSSFMEDSGLLEGIDFGHGAGGSGGLRGPGM